MLQIISLLLISQNPVIMTREPTAASPWVQSVQAGCGDSTLSIEGYGAARPEDRAARVMVDGQAVTGDAAPRLLEDLSNRRAAYRFEILCGRAGDFTIRLHEGEGQPGGTVRYRTANAVIRNGRLESYSGHAPSDEASFWFR
jgi:hypothetical protein